MELDRVLAAVDPDIPTLFGLPWVGLTAPVLLGIAILLLLTGRIVPRAIVQMMLRDKDREADKWREAYEAEREARVTANAQTAELLTAVRTSRDVITALFEVLKVDKSTGEPDAVPKKRT